MRSGSLLAVAVLVVVLGMEMSGSAYAPLTTITPSADNNIFSYQPDDNYGANDWGYIRSGDPDYIYRLVLKFDLSVVPACSSVDSAYLLLYYFGYAPRDDPAGKIYYAYRLVEDWSEMGSTWNSRDTGVPWTTPGGVWITEDSASSTVPPSPQWMSWDVTGIVKDWIESNQPNSGFIIRDPNDGVDSGTEWRARFYLSESSESVRPVLKIDYTAGSCPAVGGIVMPANTLALLAPWLAVIGLVGCIGTIVVVAKKRQS